MFSKIILSLGIMEENSTFSRHDKTFMLLFALFIAGLTIASVLAGKIIDLFGFYVPAGVIAYSITFIATDVISEIWGRAKANFAVFSGFCALVLVMILVNIAMVLKPAPFWQGQDAFRSVLSGTSRIIIASFIAYLVSQFHDVWAFHFWKKVTHGRYLWLRNNLSTMVSQLIDTALFITIAFYGEQPVLHLIFGQYVIKLLIAVVDTPVVYALVSYLRRGRVIQYQK
ncbi:MAG: queuosine precursor transporter [candidate division KSB1 bacterium]|jgi:uncharacterized integral membrane protein (TIGR00697 family)|nr:queuosine precursor transporter [candidate division KSB1 bacterium]